MAERLTKARVQRAMNRFTKKYVEGVGPVRVDGDWGPASIKRASEVKFWLGYTSPISGQWRTVTERFVDRMNTPGKPSLSSKTMIDRGKARRRKQQAEARRPLPAMGVSLFDGRKAANAAIPHMEFARAHGWEGWLVSGWRDPDFSESLCMDMCGHPSCPGKCAGKASNHVGRTPDRFAIDVAFWEQFGEIVKRSPHQPRIFNDLPKDRVHYSPNGH